MKYILPESLRSVCKRASLFAVALVVAAPTYGAVCAGSTVTILGTANADSIGGTSGNDVIHGAGGSDSIDGNGGNDVICGGHGDDYITGGAGNDTINGHPGFDVVRGNSGTDDLRGDQGRDDLYDVEEYTYEYGGDDNDTLQVYNGEMWGGYGYDTCTYEEIWYYGTIPLGVAYECEVVHTT